MYRFYAKDDFGGDSRGNGEEKTYWTLTLHVDKAENLDFDVNFYIGRDQNYKTNGNKLPIIKLWKSDGKSNKVGDEITVTDAEDTKSGYNCMKATVKGGWYVYEGYGWNAETKAYDVPLGGMQIKLPADSNVDGAAAGGTEIYLRLLSIYTTSKKVDGSSFTKDDFTVRVSCPIMQCDAVMGTPYVESGKTYYPTLFYAGGNACLFNVYYNPTDTETYIFSQQINQTLTAGNSVNTKSYKIDSVVKLPVTDRHKVSRAKLAYLIDATAAPVCMIAPISSWAAAVSGVVEDYNGFDLFVRAIPYNFYSLLTFVFIIALILMKFDYGPMRLHEMNARFKDDLYTTGDRADANSDAIECNQNGRVIDLILPVAVLIVTCFAGLVYVGGYWDAAGDYYHDFVGAFGNTDAFAALPWGSLIALVFTIIYFLCRRLISFKAAMDCLPKGFINMVPAIMILTFATSLKNMTGLLGGKYFVASVMNSAAGSLFSFLPAIIFIVAGVLSFSTGTSWGTFGILLPIVTYVFDPASELFIIGVSACLAGAVFGDHCSPISDTTIMASAGAMCNHVNHVSTQLPYAATLGIICFVNYILAGFIQNVYISLAIGVVLVLAVLFIIRAVTAKKPVPGFEDAA